MKIPQKKKAKTQENKKKPFVKPKKEHILIVAQEIKFARLLSSNEQKTRDRALKTLKKWLTNCFQKNYEFKDDDFSRIWKGLFYAVWMSDKPLVQEELCENIAGILDLFPVEQYKHALLMVKVGLRALASEWYGIDQHRMDKCLMLVRRYLRGSLRAVARSDWSEKACKLYAKMLSGTDGILALKTPLYARNATSMILHFIDCFLEEISKVSEGKIPEASLAELLRPICVYMCGGEAPSISGCCRRLLNALIRQSGAGLKYRDRTAAWEQMGCPEGGPDALVSDDESDDEAQNNGQDDDDDRDKPLDPRAGRVSVMLSPLPVPSARIAQMLADLLTHTTHSGHKRAKLQMVRFQQLAKDEYPLKVSEELTKRASSPEPNPAQAAGALSALEKQLVSSADELALRGLSRKHRKRLLARSRAGISIVEDVAELKASQCNAAGDWKVEETKESTKKAKKDNSNKENQNKQKKRKLQNGDSQQNGDVAAKKIKHHTPKLTDKKDAKLKNKKQKSDSKVEIQKKDSKPVEKTKTKLELSKTPVIKQKVAKIEKVVPKINNKKNSPTVVAKKVKNFQKQFTSDIHTPKKVKFALKNNSMQETFEYYKSVRQSPSIPFDSKKIPTKTNLKPSTPSPINPFFKKKWKINN